MLGEGWQSCIILKCVLGTKEYLWVVLLKLRQCSVSQRAASCHAQKEQTMRPNLLDVLNAAAPVFVAASLPLVRYYLQGTHSVIGRIDTEGVKKKEQANVVC